MELQTSLLKTLFRGKKLGTEEWVYGYLLVRKGRSFIATRDAVDFMVATKNSSYNIILTEVAADTISVYTLYNDRNDIKVFTGDVLKTTTKSPSPFSTEFHVLVCYDADLSMIFCDGFCPVDAYEFRYCEVIGNMFDNPELLDTIEFRTCE